MHVGATHTLGLRVCKLATVDSAQVLLTYALPHGWLTHDLESDAITAKQSVSNTAYMRNVYSNCIGRGADYVAFTFLHFKPIITEVMRNTRRLIWN